MFFITNAHELLIAIFSIAFLATALLLLVRVLLEKTDLGKAIAIIVFVAIFGALVIWQTEDFLKARAFSVNIGTLWIDLFTKKIIPVE